MKIGIDSYCYHRYFGEIYDFQQDPGKRITFDHFLKRSNELGVDVVSLETCFFPENDQDFLKKLKDQIIELVWTVVAWGHLMVLKVGKKPGSSERLRKHLRTCQELNAQDENRRFSLAFRREPHGPIEKVSKILVMSCTV